MKNLQGDVIGITDTSGNIVAKYTYDSWGKLISIKDANDGDKTADTTSIGYINPLRYRGYYYDSETGLYYLNARYYDPEVGMYINASSITTKREYGTYVYEVNTIRGLKYTYTDPHTSGRNEGVRFDVLLDRRRHKCYIRLESRLVTVVAVPHTHGAYSIWYDNDEFSAEDKETANDFNVPSYLVSPLGELRRYDPNSPLKNGVLLRTDMPFDPSHLKIKLRQLFS